MGDHSETSPSEHFQKQWGNKDTALSKQEFQGWEILSVKWAKLIVWYLATKEKLDMTLCIRNLQTAYFPDILQIVLGMSSHSTTAFHTS